MKGIDFHEDMRVDVDVLSIHYSEEVWGPEDPNKFHPSRYFKKIC